jgi:hypothetical protein
MTSSSSVIPSRSCQRASVAVSGQRHEIGVPEAFADLRRPLKRFHGGREVAGHGAMHGLWNEEVSPFDAVERGIIEEASGTREPPARLCVVAILELTEGDPERAARRAGRISRVEVGLVGARERRRACLVSAEQKRGGTEALQIGRLEVRASIGRGQRIVRRAPRLASKGRPPAIERGARGHLDGSPIRKV